MTRQHKSGRQHKRIVAIANGKNLRCVKGGGVPKRTVRLVELHEIANLEDCKIYLRFLSMKNV